MVRDPRIATYNERRAAARRSVLEATRGAAEGSLTGSLGFATNVINVTFMDSGALPLVVRRGVLGLG